MKKPRHSLTIKTCTPRQPTRLEKNNAELRYRTAIIEKNNILMVRCVDVCVEEHEKAVGEIAHPRVSLQGNEYFEREDELKRLRIENIEFRRLGAEEKEVRRLYREVMTLQERLDEKCGDCKLLEMTLKIAREDNAKLQSVAAMAPRPSNYLRK